MNRDVLFGILRHLLTTIGGSLAARGFIKESVINDLVGLVLVLLGCWLSALNKKKHFFEDDPAAPAAPVVQSDPNKTT